MCASIFARFVQFISPKGNEIDVISRQIANAHTTFNIVCTLIWLPLIPFMVKIVTTIIRGTEKQRDDGPVSVLESGVIAQPAAALYLVSEELEHMAEVGSKLLTALKESFSSDKTQSEAATEQYKTYRRQAARMEDDLAAYVTKMLSSGNLTQQQSGQAAGLCMYQIILDVLQTAVRKLQVFMKKLHRAENHSQRWQQESCRIV